MARAFRATTRGYRADLDAHERRLLSQLCADVISLLEARGAEPEQAQGALADERPDQDAEADDDFYEHFRRELAGLGTGYDEESGISAGGESNGDGSIDTGAAQPAGMTAPEDPVLARLLPDAVEDPKEAAQLRRLTEASLRESKLADLRTTRMLLESETFLLSEDQAPVFGRALNDVRLTLATRLGIVDDADAEPIHHVAATSRGATTEQFMAEVYAFTTWLQESLFTAMLEFLPDEEQPHGPQDGEP